MPKSKRAKVIHLSKVEKKGKDLSVRLFNNVRECADQYGYCFVFAVDNMRNTFLKSVRSEYPDSRLFFGKTKVMAKALGTTREEEHLPNLSLLAPYLTGNVGLFFTNQEPEDITSYFSEYSQTDFARAGVTASRTFTVPAGVVYSRAGEVAVEEDAPMDHPMEPMLRKWGMPTRLVKGRIMLDQEYEVCIEGQELNSHQTALLKIFGVATAEFRLRLVAYYDAAKQSVVPLETTEET